MARPTPAKPNPNPFNWSTKLDATTKSAILKDARALCRSHEHHVEKYKTYTTATSHLRSRASVEAERKCHDCGLSKITIDAESKTCFSHPVKLRDTKNPQLCTKCGGNVDFDQGCTRQWEHKITPANQAVEDQFVVLSAAPNKKKRALVVIDAEFITIFFKDGSCTSVIASVAMIDGITGEILINRIVAHPKWANYKHTSYFKSGLDAKKIADARANGSAIMGMQKLHETLSQFVDANTIFCGHAFFNDLNKMKLGVNFIIDTQILHKKKEKGAQVKGLKTLAEKHLKIPGFQATEHHDALEDACVTRELLLLKCLGNNEDSDSGYES